MMVKATKTRAAFGMLGISSAVEKNLKSGFSICIGLVSEMTRASPRATSIMPSVAMNGGNPRIEMLNPFTAPTSAPKATASSSPSANGRFRNLPPRKNAVITAARLSPVPADRSMPPVAMTKVAPSAMMPMDAERNRMSGRVLGAANPGALKTKKA